MWIDYWKLSAIFVRNWIECHYHKSRYTFALKWIELNRIELYSSCPKIESMSHYSNFNIVLMIIVMWRYCDAHKCDESVWIRAIMPLKWICTPHLHVMQMQMIQFSTLSDDDILSKMRKRHANACIERKWALRCTFYVVSVWKKDLCEKMRLTEMKRNLYDQNYWRLANKLPTYTHILAVAVVLIDVKTCFWPSFNDVAGFHWIFSN